MSPALELVFAAGGPLPWLFVAGHLLGDFLLQPGWLVDNKRRPSMLLLHGGIVTLAHLAILTPVLSGPVAAAAVGVGAAHLGIDALKTRGPWRRPGGLGLFAADQAAHLASIAVAVWLLSAWAAPVAHVPPSALTAWTALTLTLGVFAFVWTGGDTIVRATLAGVSETLGPEGGAPGGDPESRADGVPGSGRMIGILERTLALILIILGEWAAIVLLVAVKSIARFEALKQRRFAEYYLIGTLTSLLVAVLAGLFLAIAVFRAV